MYRNAVYNGRNQSVTIFSWDENGKRISFESTFHPYLYIEDPRGDKTSIYGTKVKKRSFNTAYERNKFLTDSGIKRVYENLPASQQFLVDCYWRDNEKEDFSRFPIKVVYLDIETYSPDSFPDTANPTHPINVITCYDSLSEKFFTFGTKPYTPKDSNVIYKYCKSERELFTSFIEYLEEDYPDILSGWNCEGFDFPYIINRCERILGEEYVKRLSPLSNVYFRPIRGKFGKEMNRYYIDGISCIDYMDIYRKFCMVMRESYKLDSIAEIELSENKIDYGDMDLATLADKDWNTFVDYNIHDVRLLVKLEEKLQYISLLRMLAYVGLTTYEGALGSVSLLTGAMCIKARHNNEVMSTFVRNQKEGTNPGAYVSEPLRGFQQCFATFDAASLYPSVMMSLNMSPETKIGRFAKNEKGNFEIYHISGKTFELTPEKFSKFLKEEKCCMSRANILFTQKKRGIVPQFLDEYFQRRVETKKQLRAVDSRLSGQRVLLGQLRERLSPESRIKEVEAEIKRLKYEKQFLDTKQLIIKITINSLYGVFGNKQASFGDDDIASSVTLTGQAIIKQSNDIIREFIKSDIPDLTEREYNDTIIYNDTDSYTFDTQVVTDRGTFDAESLWDEFSTEQGFLSMWGHEIIPVNDLNVWSYDKRDNRAKFRKVKNLIRHKVSKDRFKIKVGDREITMTGDHGCLVCRDGELVRVKASEIVRGDKMIVSD